MQRLESAYGRALEALALAACALIFGMTLMICVDVLLRNVRLVPGVVGLAWSNEISEAMLYLVTLLTAPWLMRKGQHIRVDIVLRAVPRPLGWAFEWVVDALAMICCAVIAYYGARAALGSFMAGSILIKTLGKPDRGPPSRLPPPLVSVAPPMC